MTKIQMTETISFFNFENLNLEFICNLVLGIWNLRSNNTNG